MKEEKIKIKSEMDGLVLDCLLIEPDKEIEYYYNHNGTSQLDKSAFSNALIIAAVLALIAIVIIVTLSILNYINNF